MSCCCKRTIIIKQFVASVLNGGGTESVPGMLKTDTVQAGIMTGNVGAGTVSATAADNGVVYTNNTGGTVRISTLVLREIDGDC